MKTCAGLLGILLGIVPAGAAGAQPEPATPLARLAFLRRDAARRTYEAVWANYRDRRASDDTIYRWSLRWLEAERQLSEQQADQVAAFRAHYDRMVELQRLVQRVQRTGQATIDEVSGTEFYRVEAEFWLLEAKEKKNR